MCFGENRGEHRLRIMPWVVHVRIGKQSTEDNGFTDNLAWDCAWDSPDVSAIEDVSNQWMSSLRTDKPWGRTTGGRRMRSLDAIQPPQSNLTCASRE
jgi:hypothetical protein